MEAKEKPLFDLLNTPIQPQNQSSENKWDNNPFLSNKKSTTTRTNPTSGNTATNEPI